MTKETVSFVKNGAQEFQEIDVKEFFESKFNGSTIFRGITPQGDDLVIKLSVYPWGAEREWLGLNKAREGDIKVPQPFALVTTSDGRTGISTRYVDGQLLYLNPSEEYRYAAGGIVSYMQANVIIEGSEWTKQGKKDFTYYDKTISHWKKNHVRGLEPSGQAIGLMEQLSLKVGNTFQTTNPVFLHNDLHDGQFILGGDSNLVLIDFEFWREGHPMGDLATYLYHNIRHGSNPDFFYQLCKGYIGNSDFGEGQKNALAFLLIFYSGVSLDFYRKKMPESFELALDVHAKIMKLIAEELIWKKLK